MLDVLNNKHSQNAYHMPREKQNSMLTNIVSLQWCTEHRQEKHVIPIGDQGIPRLPARTGIWGLGSLYRL